MRKNGDEAGQPIVAFNVIETGDGVIIIVAREVRVEPFKGSLEAIVKVV